MPATEQLKNQLISCGLDAWRQNFSILVKLAPTPYAIASDNRLRLISRTDLEVENAEMCNLRQAMPS